MAERVALDDDASVREVRASGAWVFGGRLHPPSTATVVRVRDGEVLTTDGPFAAGKEHLGGLLITTAPDLDAALEWGRKQAQATTLPIEVRPFHGAAGGWSSPRCARRVRHAIPPSLPNPEIERVFREEYGRAAEAAGCAAGVSAGGRRPGRGVAAREAAR